MVWKHRLTPQPDRRRHQISAPHWAVGIIGFCPFIVCFVLILIERQLGVFITLRAVLVNENPGSRQCWRIPKIAYFLQTHSSSVWFKVGTWLILNKKALLKPTSHQLIGMDILVFWQDKKIRFYRRCLMLWWPSLIILSFELDYQTEKCLIMTMSICCPMMTIQTGR